MFFGIIDVRWDLEGAELKYQINNKKEAK